MGFSATKIPSKTVLVFSDLLLVFLVVTTNESVIMRLQVDHGFRHALHIWFVGLSYTAVVIPGMAERVYAIFAGANWGFAWNKSDWIDYAILKVLYSSVYLGLALFSFAAAFVVVLIRNRLSRYTMYGDLCGKVCSTLLAIIIE